MIPVSKGVFCHLERPSVDDIKVIVRWLKDPYLRGTVFDPGNFVGSPKDQAKAWVEGNAQLFAAEDIVFIAKRNKDNAPLGLFILKNIDWRNRTADVNYVIGDEKFRQSVFGPEMTLLGLMWAFYNLNLHSIYGYVLSGNKASRGLASFGAKTDGVLKRYFKSVNGWEDYIMYSLLKPEFDAFLLAQKEGLLRRHAQKDLISEDFFESLVPLHK